MASKDYARFTNDDDDDEQGPGDTTLESPTSPAVLQATRGEEDPSSTAAEHRDLQPGLDHKFNDITQEGTNPDTTGDVGQGDGDPGDPDRGGGGNDDSATQTRSSRWTYAAFYQWVMSNAVMLYTSQFLSAWGDRMWSFTVALYLVEIQEHSLRLTAIYGLCVSGSSLIFGAAIGRWVDKTPRLRAARTSLIIQNSSVLINACLLCTVLILKTDILQIWNGGLYIICQLIIIFLGTVASLASLAELICIQKDWVVVVAGGDKDVLAVLNANMRRIDLVSNILAPIAVGAIMTASTLVGGIFVAAWNAGSMVIEYWNLSRVYRNVPELAFKGGVGCTDEALPKPVSRTTKEEDVEREMATIAPGVTPVTMATKKDEGCCGRVTAKLKDMFEGWKVYKSYVECWAGLGMAFLYMTVLGFDSITLGYGYSQGMPEYAMGILQALGSISGIFGTMLYPFMRRKIGLERSGLYSLGIEIAFLMLCVGSLWAPGSPFIYDYGNSTVDASRSSPPPLTLTTPYVGVMGPPAVSTSSTEAPDLSTVQCKYTGTDQQQTSLVSAAILFTGIVLSRIGLWAYDLVVTQLVQEHVLETERGVFNGVQRALECSFDMVHFILVIALPCPETFGYLVIASVVFIIIGACCYMVYSYKIRGHLVHMEKFTPCMTRGHVE